MLPGRRDPVLPGREHHLWCSSDSSCGTCAALTFRDVARGAGQAHGWTEGNMVGRPRWAGSGWEAQSVANARANGINTAICGPSFSSQMAHENQTEDLP